MIVVRVDLWPFGSRTGSQRLGNLRIENHGGPERGCRYYAELDQAGDPELGIHAGSLTVEIPAHDRRQSVWMLIQRVLSAALRPEGAGPPPSGHDLPDDVALGWFLDVLASAWGLSQHELEAMLDLSPGWLRAWRNHEVTIDHALAARIRALGVLQERMRMLRTPENYRGFWHHVWAESSPIGRRSPWQAFVDDGPQAIEVITRFLHDA